MKKAEELLKLTFSTTLLIPFSYDQKKSYWYSLQKAQKMGKQ